MSEPAIPYPVEIICADPNTRTIALMQYLVGFGLSRWHMVEGDLTMIYLCLVCPKDGPLDGALASFNNIQTVEGKLGCLRKVMPQVLFQDRFTAFRKTVNSVLNRIGTLNENRNRLAHGIAQTIIEDGREVPYFLPYYNLPAHFRERVYVLQNEATGIIIRQQKWGLKDLHKVVEGLQEGPRISKKLLDDLIELYANPESNLEAAKRMTLECGLPFVLKNT